MSSIDSTKDVDHGPRVAEQSGVSNFAHPAIKKLDKFGRGPQSCDQQFNRQVVKRYYPVSITF
jgi:hypothetical protein